MNKKMKDFCKHKKKDPDYCTKVKLDEITSVMAVLLGPNGTGKSTSMNLMKEELDKRNIKYLSYSTRHDDIVIKCSSPFRFEPAGIACAFHSEGERMTDSFLDFMEKDFLKEVLENKDRELYVFIDEADSGLSLDMIYRQLLDLMYIVKEKYKRGRNVKLIISANSFELCEPFLNEDNGLVEFIWTPTKEKITFNSYSEFREPYIEYFKEMYIDEGE